MIDVSFYHLTLNHIGIMRLCDTITLHFYHPHLSQDIEGVVGPGNTSCQRYKLPGRGHGHLPTKTALIAPSWQEASCRRSH